MTPITSIIIHGHFYQPPREDPWLEEIEAEASAAPFHDWNERIERECYRAVVAARIPGPEGRIARIVNTLEGLSFNFGPTLLEWMEHRAPDTYAAVLAADRASLARLGHGNAIAMPYHHAILPLSTLDDKRTEVRWGIADFRRRFGREPEGMWLPETAVDEETLEVLATEGIRFTILAPHQVTSLPAGGMPGLYRTSTGDSIALFVYDGAISHDVAFGALVRDAEAWFDRLLAPDEKGKPRRLVGVATDGETYGHHHKFGEMALARVLTRLVETPRVRVENFASFLARHPASEEVKVVSPSAWSCAHGVERWRSDCGCRIAPERATQQAWRAPLRDAVGWLGAELETLYRREGARVLVDAYRAREHYGDVVGTDGSTIRSYIRDQVRADASPEEVTRAGELLEMVRGALRSFTSCGWFFDDIGGIETVEVLRYAARAIELSGSDRDRLDQGFSDRLAPALSNDRALGTGRDIYLRHARPQIAPVARVAAGIAAAHRYAPDAAEATGYGVEANGDHLTLVHQRTGRRFTTETVVERRGLGVAVTVTLSGTGEPEHLNLHELPERQREAVTNALRAECVERWFSTGERARLSHGEVSLREVTQSSLRDAVAALANDHSAVALARATELLELFENLGGWVPFEVQTRFYRIWKGAADVGSLNQLARAMGFAVEGERGTGSGER